MLSPLIFKLDGRALRVEKKSFYQDKFKDDTAYLLSKYNPYVYPYYGKVKDKNEIVEPGIYILNKKVYIKRPITEEEKKLYDKQNIIKLTPESIFKDLDRSECLEFTNIVSFGEDDIFTPAITENDDIALAGMKFAIGKKQINFNNYGHKFTDQATKNNGRRALTHGTTLKMEMLSRYANVFDLGVGLVFYDKRGCTNPMDKEYKKAYVIFDSEPTDLNKKEFVEISVDKNIGKSNNEDDIDIY